MAINKQLVRASSFNPTKQTYQMTTLNLCESIEKNEITLPLYQRDMSWTLKKCVALFDYQLLGKAPVSPISVNKVSDVCNVTQITLVDRNIVDCKPGQLSIVDGQQRLTTNFKAYVNHDEFRSIVLDLAKGYFLIEEAGIKKHQIPVGILLNKSNEVFFSYINNNSTLKKQETVNLLLQIRSKLRDYNYTINMANDLTEDEQIDWFEVLNNAGSRVTRVQMRFSKLKLDGIDIYTQYTIPYVEKLEAAGYDLFDMKNTEVSIPVANLNCAYEVVTNRVHTPNFTPIPSDLRENQLCTLDAVKLRKCFSLTLDALDQAIQFVDNNCLKTSTAPDRIDYITYLTGYFVFHKNDDLGDSRQRALVEWFKTVNFSNKSNSARRTIFSNLLDI